jgi:uncharacterized membrane protein
VFLVVFSGPLVLLPLAAVLHRRHRTVAFVLLLAAVCYAIGVIGVTFAGNVPLNEDLADRTGLDAGGFASARADFEDSWNRLNLVRALASFAAFALATSALVLRPRMRG